MKPVTVTAQNGVDSGFSPAVAIDYLISPVNLGLSCVITGAPTYKVQYTLDNVLDPTVTPTWVDSTDLAGETSNQYGSIVTPVRAVRAAVTAGTGSVAMTVVQAGAR